MSEKQEPWGHKFVTYFHPSEHEGVLVEPQYPDDDKRITIRIGGEHLHLASSNGFSMTVHRGTARRFALHILQLTESE